MLSYANVESVMCPDRTTRCARPLFMTTVSAGFPSPAEGYIEGRLDLNRYLIKHPTATFYVQGLGRLDVGRGD